MEIPQNDFQGHSGSQNVPAGPPTRLSIGLGDYKRLGWEQLGTAFLAGSCSSSCSQNVMGLGRVNK